MLILNKKCDCKMIDFYVWNDFCRWESMYFDDLDDYHVGAKIEFIDKISLIFDCKCANNLLVLILVGNIV